MSERPAAGRNTSRKSSLDARGGTGTQDVGRAVETGRGAASPRAKAASETKSRIHGKGPTSPIDGDAALASKRVKVHAQERHESVDQEMVYNRSDGAHTQPVEHNGLSPTVAGHAESREASTFVQPTRLVQLPSRLGSDASAQVSRKDKDLTGLASTRSKYEIDTRFKAFDAAEANAKIWTGDDIEDQLDDQVIKEGFVSKPKVSNEQGTAKPTLSPHLRKTDGLLNMSLLFVLAINERRNAHTIVGLSSFKPPPRVTLTDARKTAWFVDLANMSVPLRRLSRTVPHGIRGKHLLEQCCIHHVPTSRALWLAKCVGANELRAFRRKGVSSQLTSENELRWIQEWTESVSELWWATLHGDLTVPELTEMVHLVICLFAEGMLHRTQFLDGIFGKLGSCTIHEFSKHLGTLVIWHYDILASFRWTRRFATMLAERMKEVQHHETLCNHLSLVSSMSQLLNSTCAALPRPWLYPAAFPLLAATEADPDASKSFESLNEWRAIEGVDGDICLPLTEQQVQHDQQRRLLQALDDCSNPKELQHLVDLSPSEHSFATIKTIMVWASSSYRAQIGAASVAALLIRRVFGAVYHVPDEVLTSITALAADPKTSSGRIAKLCQFLSASDVFDVAAYMRTLIASGTLYTGQGTECHVAILQAISPETLSGQANNMRSHILHSLHSASTPLPVLINDHEDLKKSLPSIWFKFQHDECAGVLRQGLPLPASSQWPSLEAIQSAFRVWDSLGETMKFKSLEESRSFCALLHSSEDVTTFPALLSPVIRAAGSTALMPIAELIGAFEPALTLSGSFTELRDLLIARYRALRLVRPASHALLNLLLSIRTLETWQRRYLEDERRLCDESQYIVANTPASDILTVEGATPYTIEETYPLKRKHDGPPALTQAHVELLITMTDGTFAPTTLLAAIEYLRSSLSAQPLEFGHTLPLMRLMHWIIRKHDDHESQICNELHDVCTTDLARDVCITAIARHTDVVVPLIMGLCNTQQPEACPRCQVTVAKSLLKPHGDDDSLEYFSTPDNDMRAGYGDALFHVVRSVLGQSDHLSARIQRVGLGVLAHAAVRNTPGNLPDGWERLQAEVGRAALDCHPHWAELVSLLPEPLDVISPIRQQAEAAMLKSVTYIPDENNSFDHSDMNTLIAVVKEASIWAPISTKVPGISGQILGALQARRPQSGERRNLFAPLLSLCLIHHRSFDAEDEQKALIILLCEQIVASSVREPQVTQELLFTTAGHFVYKSTQSVIDEVTNSLTESVRADKNVRFLLGIRDDPFTSVCLRLPSVSSTKDPSLASTLAAFNLSSDDPTEPPHSLQRFEVRNWDMLPDASAKEGENDTPLGLRLFDTRRIG